MSIGSDVCKKCERKRNQHEATRGVHTRAMKADAHSTSSQFGQVGRGKETTYPRGSCAPSSPSNALRADEVVALLDAGAKAAADATREARMAVFMVTRK